MKNTFWETHGEDFASTFSEQLFWVNTKALKDREHALLLNEAQIRQKNNEFRRSFISKGIQKKRALNIRTDLISWVEENEISEHHLVNSLFSGLLQTSRKLLYLPGKRFECFFAHYDTGSFYVKHKDRHKRMPARLLTCVIHLNTLPTTGGGELVLYADNRLPVSIRPIAGQIVIFDSSMTHEVKLCKQPRWSLTGWIREDIYSGLSITD